MRANSLRVNVRLSAPGAIWTTIDRCARSIVRTRSASRMCRGSSRSARKPSRVNPCRSAIRAISGGTVSSAIAFVPALETANCIGAIWSRPRWRSCSTNGDRQMLPVHTARMRNGATSISQLPVIAGRPRAR